MIINDKEYLRFGIHINIDLKTIKYDDITDYTA